MVATAVLNSGDTAWMLTATALVMLMTVPGVALYYGGLVKRENVLNTLFMSIIAFAITSVIWVIYAYQFAFGTDVNGLIGNGANILFFGITSNTLAPLAPTIPVTIYSAFELVFAAITVALISGAVVGRLKFKAWLAFVPLWITIVYVPISHWVWGGGWLAKIGALDFAGGTVVHLDCGIAALVLCIYLGSRKDTKLLPHHLGYSVLGAALLWFGWFGFNAGSALTAGGLASSAFLVTNTATAAAMISWMLIDIIKTGKPTVLGAITGAVCGLVAITPASGYVSVEGALILGFITSFFSYYAMTWLKPRFGYDDSLDVFAVHGVSGAWGALATGLFAAPFINPAGVGLFYGNPMQMVWQLIDIGTVIAWSGGWTLVIAFVIDKTIGLRVTDDEELEGLDTTLHEESGYRI